jgi:murein DD-endopeptidase MepM/ murein hydrolase activator NlpD
MHAERNPIHAGIRAGRSTSRGSLILLLLLLGAHSACASIGMELFWPTPNPAYLEGKEAEAYLQPTASGRLESARYGCTRNNGRVFHEGLDLKPIQHDAKGRSTDPVCSISSGTVAHINHQSGKSNYGRYVVIRHQSEGMEWCSLYAHLRSIPDHLRTGQSVRGGDIIGIMGNSSSSIRIPEYRAHLHLEIGMILNRHFDRWYARKGFESPNEHGPWNGMNVVGVDPERFFRFFLDHPDAAFSDFFNREKTAMVTEIHFSKTPDFLLRNPGCLLDGSTPQAGWYRVGWTWYGLPIRWESLPQKNHPSKPGRSYQVVQSSKPERCRAWLRQKTAHWEPTDLLDRQIAILSTPNAQ